jgi:alpha-glucosidase
VKGGWASWSVGNHDVMRVMSRWGGSNPTPAVARLVLAMQLALKGTPCLYQGDELALVEADVPFELLQDPYGITFWPEFKGRDGCRTPMPWDASAPHAGFTSGQPWLPVAEPHVAASASVQESDPDSTLNFARRLIHWRRQQPQLTRGEIKFFDAPEPVLALQRDLAGHPSIVAVFNLGPDPVSVKLPAVAGVSPMSGHGMPGSVDGDQVSLPAYGAWFGSKA